MPAGHPSVSNSSAESEEYRLYLGPIEFFKSSRLISPFKLFIVLCTFLPRN
jgi:hypothetical protein